MKRLIYDDVDNDKQQENMNYYYLSSKNPKKKFHSLNLSLF